MKLEGKVALVTGAGRGIGRTIAEHLAQAGARVAVCARTQFEIDEVVATIKKAGGAALALPVDLSKPEECRQVVRDCREKLGGLDILVNNAAIPGPMGPVTDCSFEDWSRTLQVNLNSAFLCSKEAVPFMRERGGGRIINISSAAGVQPFAGLGAYSVSKAGLIMLTRTLSAELAPQITANCILPGMVVTDVSRMKAGAEALGMTYEAFIKLQVEAKHMNHLGRPTEASEVANTVLFLASGHAGSITGAVVNHGGGWF